MEPKTAFVLGGGGSLGAVEVGMLKALIDHGVEPDLVVGTSVGAINGAFFAARPDLAGVQELKRIWLGIRRRDTFPLAVFGGLLSLLSLRNHLSDSGGLRRLLEKHLPLRDLSRACIDCHLVATDVLTGEEVLLSSGPAIESILASSAIPGVFPPVELGGRLLCDGGVSNNTPISVAIALGAQVVIVLPTGFSCTTRSPPRSSLEMALHGLSHLIARQLVVDAERFSDAAQLRIVPPLCPLHTLPLDFSTTSWLIDRADECTREWLEAGGLDQGGVPDSLRPHSHP